MNTKGTAQIVFSNKYIITNQSHIKSDVYTIHIPVSSEGIGYFLLFIISLCNVNGIEIWLVGVYKKVNIARNLSEPRQLLEE